MNLKDEKILSAFEEKQSITGVHKITGYTKPSFFQFSTALSRSLTIIPICNNAGNFVAIIMLPSFGSHSECKFKI